MLLLFISFFYCFSRFQTSFLSKRGTTLWQISPQTVNPTIVHGLNILLQKLFAAIEPLILLWSDEIQPLFFFGKKQRCVDDRQVRVGLREVAQLLFGVEVKMLAK